MNTYEFKEARIGYNYHVEYEKFYYSTDYAYAGNPCFVRATKDAIEVFVDGERIAAHKRNYNKSNRYSTDPDHMRQEHKAVSGLEYWPLYLMGRKRGPLYRRVYQKCPKGKPISRAELQIMHGHYESCQKQFQTNDGKGLSKSPGTRDLFI